VGGNNLTNDIAVGLRAPFATAEQLKIKFGHALPEMVDPNEIIDVAAFGEGEVQSIPRTQLAQIIEARAEEMLAMILNEVKRSGHEGLLPAGLVLTGGTAELRGFKELGREMMGLPVRVGNARGVAGLTDAVGSPAYATAVGLLQWGMRYGTSERRLHSRGSRWSELYQRFVEILRAFLPH
jgi:cell division protein FtsA